MKIKKIPGQNKPQCKFENDLYPNSIKNPQYKQVCREDIAHKEHYLKIICDPTLGPFEMEEIKDSFEEFFSALSLNINITADFEPGNENDLNKPEKSSHDFFPFHRGDKDG